MIFFHIGVGKCGSSTIQHFASAHAAALAEHGVLYPPMQGRHPEHHTKLASALADGRPRARTAAAELLREPLRHDGNLFLSSEFVHHSDPTEAARRAQLARQLFGTADVRIMVYIRPYPSWVVSLYAQRTKRGDNVLSIDDFVQRDGFLRRVTVAPAIAEWAKVFGAENLRVRSIARGDLVGGDLVADLLSALDIHADLPPPPRVNESPAWTFVELARALTARWHSRVQKDPELGKVPLLSWLKRLNDACDEEMARSGLKAEPITYLSELDWVTLRAAYNWDIRQINASLPNHALSPMPESDPPPRAFMPELREVPAEILQCYRGVLARKLLRNRVPAEMRDDLAALLRKPRRMVAPEASAAA
jgi:hypothetical protein